jgi:hypothetical protein
MERSSSTWRSDESCSCEQTVRWKRVQPGCARIPKLIWSHAIAATASVKLPPRALPRPNRWSIVLTYRRTLPKPWSSSFASRSVCSKRQPKAAQERHVLQRGQRCRNKSHKSAVLVIANACFFISGSGNCIEQDITKSRLRRLVGVSSRSVYRALAQATPPPTLRRARSSSIVDPSLSAPFCAMEPGLP